MQIEINLASQPYEDVQRFLVRWSVALFALALITAVLVYMAASAFFSWRVSDKEARGLRTQIAERDHEKANVEAVLNRPENRQTRDRSQFLNALIARKAFSWTEVFSDLEKLVPPQLHVTAIRPTINDNNQLQIGLSVGGTSREAAIELVRRMEKSPHFSQAQVQSEAMSQTNETNRDPIKFDISAIYLPAFARQGAAPQEQQADTETEARNARH